MTLTLSPKALVMAAALAGALVLAGCPSTAAECSPGLEACGSACIDPNSDKANCGGCGIACGALQICTEGTCGCREGTVDCNGTCVATANDSDNCGACGNVCGAGEVCADSACVAAVVCGETTCGANEVCGEGEICECAEGFETCGDTCVDVNTDPDNCGACGNACDDVQSCSEGQCGYGLAAACGGTAQLVGLSAGGNAGPPVQVGADGLQAISHYQGNPIVGTYATELIQFTRELAEIGTPLTTGASPMRTLSAPPYLYAVASLDHTLHIFEQGTGDSATGFGFDSVGSINFGAGTSPQGVAKVGDKLYVPLYGDIYNGHPEAGQRIAVVSISDPSAPTVVETIDLSGLDLQPYPGASPIPTPFGITEHNGSLYLPLNNLDANTFSPGGPGLLAKVDPTSGVVTTLNLDPEGCVNTYDVAFVGDLIVASCGGATIYAPDWSVESVDKSGVVLLNAAGEHLDTYAFVCTAQDCPIAQASKLAVKGDSVFVGDGAGRIVILKATAEGFTEVRGFSAEAPQAPLQACPAGDDSNHVADLVALP